MQLLNILKMEIEIGKIVNDWKMIYKSKDSELIEKFRSNYDGITRRGYHKGFWFVEAFVGV
jgi:hypothetical protein